MAGDRKQQPDARRIGSQEPDTTGGDQLKLSNQAAQLQALEAEIANLPVVDTQRVQDVQRTLATGRFRSSRRVSPTRC
ncbi:MAG: flagellar biosynthesis anti-sigma factor FlgM [Chromatiaceae bacterium]|nr:flagellar biosynthesis anti-sigma factor FlgM [Chromatiaceae bacterium]